MSTDHRQAPCSSPVLPDETNEVCAARQPEVVGAEGHRARFLRGQRPVVERGKPSPQHVVESEQEVQLRLYDVLGRRLATLYDGPLPAQESRAMPLRPDDLGLSSGAYFLRLVGEDGTRTRRLTMVR